MRHPAIAVKEAMERALHRAEEGPRFVEHTAEELRTAYRRALLRHAGACKGDCPIIVGVCARCQEPIYREEVRIRTGLGLVHGRHVNGPFRDAGEGAGDGR